jgi:hypothetical protein
MAALVLFGCFGCVLHVVPPHGVFVVQSLRTRGDESGLCLGPRSSLLAVKCEGPAFWPGLFFYLFLF